MEGSPPRMRGKDGVNDSAQAVTGITPAYAGKSGFVSAVHLAIRDHPRVCGEKALSTFSSRKNSGSPPRMRGKVIAEAGHHQIGGITPAYAGKSRIPSSAPTRFWDHPRVCGEKYIQCTNGKHARRITPAYAGKRTAGRNLLFARWDHPRVCGEKGCCKFSSRNHSGSPPRVRGKGVVHILVPEPLGITPAYAGKSR